MIIVFVLLSNFLMAQSDLNAVEEYCFSSPARMSTIMTKAKFVLVPSDKIQSNEQCTTIISAPHRRELIRNYILHLDPSVQAGFSSSQIQSEPCKLKVEKIKTMNTSDGSVTVQPSISASVKKSQGQSTETMTIQTLKEFELSVNTSVIKGDCKFITTTRYEINLEVRKDPKPFLPPTPPGTTVLVVNPTQPPPQQTLKLKTTLQLTLGQKVEIGSVIKNLNEGSSQVGLENGELNQQDGLQEEKVFLSIE